ncbi:MAG: M3 family oligoendopeptidase [Alphaproteobacteria bacterium]|nr:M3 family oligoendopeptidase [Alphaproteobacteria bacterium]
MPAQTKTKSEFGRLPRWNLDDLYPGPKSAVLHGDLKRAEKAAAAFHRNHAGKVEKMGGDALGAAIAAFEEIDETLDRAMSYAQLLYAANVADAETGRFYQTVQERVTDISAKLVFFGLEINRIDDAALAKKLKSKTLAHYASWIRDMRSFRPHQLSEDMERLLHDKRVAGRAAWNRLFDETMAALRFRVGREELTTEQTLHLLSDSSGVKRKQAAKALGKGLGENVRLFTLITNTLAKDKEIEDRWRSFPRPESSRNLANHVEDEVVAALVAAVKDAYPKLSHRYYRYKAKRMGRKTLDYWDRNAPLPAADDRPIPWRDARRLVLDAYGAFSPDLADVGRRFFDHAWIDAEARPGKASGAFAHPTVPSAHPYLLLNYMGRARDVMTLAHELGHGVHQVLAGPQGHLKCATPLTLAETASVFGEMLTFRALLARQSDPAKREAMIAGKVEDMLNTVVRQIAFYEFELRVHAERREGELSSERIGGIWLDVQRESLGPAIRFEEEYSYYWSYIPHFVHSPFYVYAYAFGDCLVNSLYAVYENAHEGFAARYLDMLRAGGTLHHRDLLAPFGLDASDPAFWSKGLGVVSGLIDELGA